MKLLLIGPYPPPHGGISVHVQTLEKRSRKAGVTTKVIDLQNAGIRFALNVARHAMARWPIHFHANGHNLKIWLLAAYGGLMARLGGGGKLTLHSGLVPDYLDNASERERALARFTCRLYDRIVCVSPAIQEALVRLGVPVEKMVIEKAFLGVDRADVPLDKITETWINSHAPVLSTAVFFRPEYGFDLLLKAMSQLQRDCPSIGCVVMGDSAHREVAAKMVQDAGLEKNVLLAGDVEHETCVGVMSRSDIFVRPTLIDGDSVSVREAAGLGIPVVASAVGTRPEEAILFPVGDAAAMVDRIQFALRTAETYA